MGLLSDARNIRDKDPAATSTLQVMLLYPGFRVLVYYKLAHWLQRHKRLFLARMVSQWGRRSTGIEIHPGATLGEHLFIDHGAGVVIGETAVVGNNVTIYHGVTLGGSGKHTGKRHPTVQDNVLLGAGVKVLGPIVIGEGSRVGANSTVLTDIPPDSTAVGSPAEVVRSGGIKCVASEELDQRNYPNILAQRLDEMEERLAKMEGRKITVQVEVDEEQL